MTPRTNVCDKYYVCDTFILSSNKLLDGLNIFLVWLVLTHDFSVDKMMMETASKTVMEKREIKCDFIVIVCHFNASDCSHSQAKCMLAYGGPAIPY